MSMTPETFGELVGVARAERDTGGKAGEPFDIVDQRQTMTSVELEAHSLKLGVSLRATITAPFWPQDEVTSTVPAYVVSLRLSRLDRVRWTPAEPDARRRGVLRFGLKVPGARIARRWLPASRRPRPPCNWPGCGWKRPSSGRPSPASSSVAMSTPASMCVPANLWPTSSTSGGSR